MNIEELKLDFDDVLIRPKRSKVPTRSQIELERTYTFKNSKKEWTGIPIISANMDTTGTFAMAQELAQHKMLTALHKHYSVEELVDFFADNQEIWDNVFYTIGIGDDNLKKLKEVALALYVKMNDVDTNVLMWRTKGYKEIRKIFPSMLCVDVANGYTEYFLEQVEKIRKAFPYSTIMAGNVVTYEMAEQLILSGVDIVKVGIGSGSVCTTRLKTGVGYPQLSAVLETKNAAHGLDGHVCSDGGCNVTGDVCKAFGAGADFVMLGGFFAGTSECEGEWEYEEMPPEDQKRHDHYSSIYNYVREEMRTRIVENENIPITISSYEQLNSGEGQMFHSWDDALRYAKMELEKSAKDAGKKFLKFYGMSSKDAQEKYHDGVKKYRTSEGKTVSIPYKGKADDVVQDILGGLRSACTYVGASKLKYFNKCCEFIRVSRTHNTVYGNGT